MRSTWIITSVAAGVLLAASGAAGASAVVNAAGSDRTATPGRGKLLPHLRH